MSIARVSIVFSEYSKFLAGSVFVLQTNVFAIL